jgi:tetratricopeptide (TPR) repeat protein/DNA-binding transcriptional MerR regulator
MAKTRQALAKSDTVLEDKSTNSSVDFVALLRVIQARCEHLGADTLLGLTELSDEIGVKQDELLYWEKQGILKPVSASKGHRSVKKYPLSEVEKAHLAQELKKRKWKPLKIAGVAALWESWEQQATQSKAPPTELDQAGRARVLLIARLLALVAQLTGGLSAPPRNCFLLAHQLVSPEELPKPNTLRVVEKDKKQVSLLARQKNSLTGVCSETGEVLLYLRDQERLQQEIEDRSYLAVQLRGDTEVLSFEIIYGFKPAVEDGQILQIQQNLDSDRVQETAFIRQHRFLLHLFYLLCVTVVDLEAELVSRLPSTSNIVHALVNAVTLVSEDKWDFAGFLTPVNPTTLRVMAASVNYPQRLKEQLYVIDASGDQVPSLPGWALAHRDHIVIENLLPNDPRLPDQNPEGLRALAIIPAIALDRTEGVIFIGSRRRLSEDRQYFDQEEIKMLYVLARIVAEAQARERLAQNDDVLLAIPEAVSPEVQGEDELRRALMDVGGTIISHARAVVGMDNYVILLAVRLEGYGRLFTLNRVAGEWLTQQIQRTLHHQLEYIVHDDWESPLPSRVFTIAGDQFVGLLGRTKENVRQLRSDIGTRLANLSQLVSQHSPEIAVVVHLWSVHFTYQDLTQQFRLDSPTESSLGKLVTHLLERTKGALRIVANVQRGDAYMRRRDYSAARTEYDIAHKNDLGNPYALRHITECLTEMGLYSEAVKYGQLAVERDPKYAGSYRRLADAYVGLDDFENALDNYRKAIDYAETDPVNHLRLAEALILRAEPGGLETIIDILNQAMGYDAPDNSTRAKYLRIKAEACVRYKQYRQASTWYEQALRFDSVNEQLHSALKLARHLAKTCE